MPAIPNLSEIKDLAPIQPLNDESNSCGEFDLRIIKAQAAYSNKTGRNGILCIIEIVDEDLASNIMHTLWFGNNAASGSMKAYNKDDDEKSNMMWRMVKDFLGSIGLDRDGEVEFDEFEDINFTADVLFNDGCDEDGKQEYPPKNELGRILG